MQARGSLCRSEYIDHRKGVLLHPLGGKSYCAAKLPFLVAHCDSATFGFVRPLRGDRDSILVESPGPAT